MVYDFLRNETAWVNHLVIEGAGLTGKEFFEAEISAWKKSKRRKDMIRGEQYYLGDHDIRQRKRMAIGESGELEEIRNLPNNQTVDNQYAKMVDQKTNYLLGKPLTFDTDEEGKKEYADALKDVFGKRFQRTLRSLGQDCLNGGVGWLHPRYDEEGNFEIKRFPPHEILPFWADAEHTELDCAVRLYEVESYAGRTKKNIEKVEIYTKEGIYYFVLDGGKLKTPENPGEAYQPHYTAYDSFGEPAEYNWEHIPLVAFRYNAQEQPLIRRVKCLQDSINVMLSDFQNNMQEDSRNTILVIKNYDGENLGEFRRNLATYGAVKVRTSTEASGGVETLKIDVDAGNFETILSMLKKALIENARGYDAKDDRLTSGQANQMNIQSMYSDIDLDANGMETELQAAFEELLWFVNQHLANTGVGDFEGKDVTVIFNRDMLVNESQVIEDCQKSIGILSDETIVAQHPWVSDAEMELARIEAEREEKDDSNDDYKDKKSDWSELEAFAKSFERLGDQVNDFLESVAKELAARMLAKVKKLTPVGQYPKGGGKKGGTLRRRWTAEVQRDGKTYVVEVVNPVEYASYVEYGHRQEPGRYVPAIGKRLVKGWVDGKYMMTISEQELRKQTPALLERMLAQWLRGAFDGR